MENRKQAEEESGKTIVKNRKPRNYGVTRKEFHALIVKASQPIKHEAQSDSKKTGT